MRVQLFNPPVHHFTGVHYRMNPQLGLPIIAAVLNEAGHQCDVVDLEALQVCPSALAAAFEAQRGSWPDVVGFTALTSSARGVQECIQALRGIGFGGHIVVGGVHVTVCPQDGLDWGADLVVTGECEGNIAELLETRAVGIRAGVQADIATIPAPDWQHHQPQPHYYWGNAPHLDKPEGLSMWTRGCPHACIFCGNAIYAPQRVRYRPVDAIAAEIAGLKRDYCVKSLFVYDDELVGHPIPAGWLSEMADAVGPLGLTWKCQGRCSRKHVTLEACSHLYRAGCRVVMWGVESFSQDVLNAIRKGTRVEDNWASLRAAKEAGLKNWLFTMVGNYRETDDDLAITCMALQQAYNEGLVDYRQTTVVTPLPGTELWQRAHDEGWLVAAPERGPQMAQAYTGTPWLTADRIVYWQQAFAEACPAGCE